MNTVNQTHSGRPMKPSHGIGRQLRTIAFCATAICAITLCACGRTYVDEELPNSFEMPVGVKIHVDLVDPMRAADIEVGETFDGTLAEPLYYPRRKIDPEGNMFEVDTLVAVVGSPVNGIGVPAPEAGVGLQLKSVTFHGGMSFPVETAILVPPAREAPDDAEAGDESEAGSMTFTLAEPADVAMVIDFRDQQEEN